MRTWIAFLRAINLGARRTFPKDAIAAAVGSVGAGNVETYINTGNVRLELPSEAAGDREQVELLLEKAFEADRGFEVPTIVLTPEELVGVGDDATRFAREHPHADGRHYVSLLKHEPSPEAVARLEARSDATEVARVGRRAVHLLLPGDGYHTARLTNAAVERELGVATNRNLTVVRTLVDRWCR